MKKLNEALQHAKQEREEHDKCIQDHEARVQELHRKSSQCSGEILTAEKLKDEAVRKYARGEITEAELNKARKAVSEAKTAAENACETLQIVQVDGERLYDHRNSCLAAVQRAEDSLWASIHATELPKAKELATSLMMRAYCAEIKANRNSPKGFYNFVKNFFAVSEGTTQNVIATNTALGFEAEILADYLGE